MMRNDEVPLAAGPIDVLVLLARSLACSLAWPFAPLKVIGGGPLDICKRTLPSSPPTSALAKTKAGALSLVRSRASVDDGQSLR